MYELLLLSWMIALFFTVFGAWLVLYNYYFKPPKSLTRMEPITILKPVKGFSEGLEKKLETFFKQEFIVGDELLFCVESYGDTACDVIRKLIAHYYRVPAKLIVKPCRFFTNPKIQNIYWAYEAAKNDLVLISDSNSIAHKEYLWSLRNGFTKTMGILTAASTVVNPSGLGQYLEMAYLSTFYVRFIFLANLLGFPIIIGASMLFRKSTARKFRGLNSIGNYLAEDYMIGQKMKALGHKTHVMSAPIKQTLENYSFKKFWTRHVRWGRMRKGHNVFVFLFEPFYGLFSSGAIAYVAMQHIDPAHTLQVLAYHFTLWFMADMVSLSATQDRFFNFKDIGAWLLRELLSLPLWAHTLVGQKIEWRGNKYRVGKGGVGIKIK